MANDFAGNPWFYDRSANSGAADVSTSLPTYRNGQNLGYHINKIIWDGATADDDLTILDSDGHVKLKMKARVNYLEIIDFKIPLEMKGLNVSVIDGTGDLFIYTGL